MRKPRKIHIYTIGGAILGAGIIPLDQAIESDLLFLLIGFAYLVILRLISEKFGRP